MKLYVFLVKLQRRFKGYYAKVCKTKKSLNSEQNAEESWYKDINF